MTDLSVLIPARNEMFLARTIQDLLANIRGDTEIIAVLDGEWAEPQVEDHERVTLLYYPQSIGQRAAANRAASIASGKYVMKVDAHCAFDEGFDVKLMADMQDDWTVVPIMRNLHAFNWVCESVLHLDRDDPERQQHTRYQGISGPCEKCGKETVRDIVWIAKKNPSSTSYCFDPTLHFFYFNSFKKRPEGQGPLSESMSLQGSCFMMTRERYFELNVCDEAFGSWGQQGSEVAIKTWLSGGRVIVNHNTFYGHMFRTAGGDFGFPYHLGGREVERARQGVRDLFLNNRWDKQIYPLSWLVEKFWPVEHWTEEDLLPFHVAGVAFSVVHPLTNLASSHFLPSGGDRYRIREEMPVDAMGLPAVDNSGSVRATEVSGVGDQLQMVGVATAPILAEMIENRNISTTTSGNGRNDPCVDNPMDEFCPASKGDVAIPITVALANPVPASGNEISADVTRYKNDSVDTKNGNSEIIEVSHDSSSVDELGLESERASTRSDSIISWGAIYYTDNCLNPEIMDVCQQQIKAAIGNHHIVSISLNPIDFGENVVLPLKRGYLTLFKQILVGLEVLDTDIVYFLEHDCLYDTSHFDFVPPREDTYYYNENWWKVDYASGRALHYQAKQLSQLCAYRSLLLQHYRERVARTEAKLKELGDSRAFRNWIRAQGFEPGTHNRAERVDRFGSDAWNSKIPSIDIRHDGNLTPSRWSQDQFRNHRSCRNWIEAKEVPGWTDLEKYGIGTERNGGLS